MNAYPVVRKTFLSLCVSLAFAALNSTTAHATVDSVLNFEEAKAIPSAGGRLGFQLRPGTLSQDGLEFYAPFVIGISRTSPFVEQKLKVEDRILAINGIHFDRTETLTRYVNGFRPGTIVSLTVLDSSTKLQRTLRGKLGDDQVMADFDKKIDSKPDQSAPISAEVKELKNRLDEQKIVADCEKQHRSRVAPTVVGSVTGSLFGALFAPIVCSPLLLVTGGADLGLLWGGCTKLVVIGGTAIGAGSAHAAADNDVAKCTAQKK